jgi:branched-subunit amino acid aminotransferase/4-amino-4-deoxychorismate lyase
MAKDSKWINERQYIEAKQPSNITEMILHSENLFYETTISNLFVVIENDGECCILTAPECKVLPGIIRKYILEICKRLEVKVIFECPDFLKKDEWKAVFVTNSFTFLRNVTAIQFGYGYCLT